MLLKDKGSFLRGVFPLSWKTPKDRPPIQQVKGPLHQRGCLDRKWWISSSVGIPSRAGQVWGRGGSCSDHSNSEFKLGEMAGAEILSPGLWGWEKAPPSCYKSMSELVERPSGKLWLLCRAHVSLVKWIWGNTDKIKLNKILHYCGSLVDTGFSVQYSPNLYDANWRFLFFFLVE